VQIQVETVTTKVQVENMEREVPDLSKDPVFPNDSPNSFSFSQSNYLDWFLLGLTYLSLFVFGIIDNSRGPVFPDILREFSLSDSQGAYFFLITSGAGLVNNLLAFWWLPRLGAYRVLQVYSIIQLLGLIGLGLERVTPGYFGVLAACAVLGVSSGGLGIAQNLLVTDSVPFALRRRALSGLHGMYGISSLLAPLLVTFNYAVNSVNGQVGGAGAPGYASWRLIFLWLTLGSAVVIVISLFRSSRSVGAKLGAAKLSSTKLSSTRLDPENLGATKEATISQGQNLSSASMGKGAEVGSDLFWRRTAFLALMLSLYVIAEISISSRLVLFARRDAGFSIENSNLLLSGFFLSLFFGRLLFTVVHFHLSHIRLLGISAIASFLFFILGLFFNPIWLAVCGFTMSWFYPTAIAMISDEMADESARATSWCVTMQSLGLMLMHFMMGVLSDRVGLRIALCIGPVCLVLVFALLALRRRNGLFS
jgi:fucose permease